MRMVRNELLDIGSHLKQGFSAAGYLVAIVFVIGVWIVIVGIGAAISILLIKAGGGSGLGKLVILLGFAWTAGMLWVGWESFRPIKQPSDIPPS